ncbi:hypothetical protein [Streptomyces sp. NPDC001652]|uniref:hypothetical protein n=1 Tax=Streptomyces sp. NPDC001652 TaxID=3154393 RepID=UPI0033284343
MASGPQKYPGASTAYFYQNAYGGDLMEVNVVVLHTTEGRSLPSYGGGASAPNLTAVPDFAAKKLRWYQHFDIDRSSRALVNLAGGVATNTNNVVQVELVGTCDPATHKQWLAAGRQHIYWPEAPDWALAGLAEFLRWAHAEHGVPLTGPKEWPAYPSSYGATSARMTGTEWNAFRGVCGHLHVTENTHGDPGAINFAKLIALAKGTTPEEDDVPTAAEIAAEVVKQLPAALWASDTAPAARPPWNNSDYFEADGKTLKNTTWTGGYMQRAQVEGIRETLALVKELGVRPPVDLSDADIATLASAVAGNAALAELIAEKVAVKLAERLAE